MKRVTQLTAMMMVLLAFGCASLRNTAEKTAVATANTVEYARQAWIAHANTGAVTEIEHAQVREVYEQYQGAMAVYESVLLTYRANPDDDLLTASLKATTASASRFVSLIQSLLPPAEAAKIPNVKTQ